MLSTILQYSTIDFKFLDLNLQQLSKFSDEIIVPICDHLFNGDKEDDVLLSKSFDIMAKYPKVIAYMFEWEGHKENTAYYHNVSRALGTEAAKNEWLFFVDADEIADDTFVPWVTEAIKHDLTYWITCYWYWREPIHQAVQFEGCGLLIQKHKCNWNVNIREERQQFHNGNKFVHGQWNHILGADGKPMMHHFSWYRSKEEMLSKVKNWAHRTEASHFSNTNAKSWEDLIEEEFSRPFNGKDFMHNYQYKPVSNKFKI